MSSAAASGGSFERRQGVGVLLVLLPHIRHLPLRCTERRGGVFVLVARLVTKHQGFFQRLFRSSHGAVGRRHLLVRW